MRVKVVNIQYDYKRQNKNDFHFTEAVFNVKDDVDMFNIYIHISDVISYKGEKTLDLGNKLNSLQTLANCERSYSRNDLELIRENDLSVWNSKGSIPYEVVNMLIEPYGFKIVEMKEV